MKVRFKIEKNQEEFYIQIDYQIIDYLIVFIIAKSLKL
jgi:hypothetical protein